MKALIVRFARALPRTLLAIPLLLVAALAIALADLGWLVSGSKSRPRDTMPDTRAATLVIPNWNGKDLLERFVPSWLAAIGNHPGSEVLVVDNGSTDGSAGWLRENYPQVRVLALPENLGFGGGSNAGFEAARTDIVVLLNSDMRVEPDFLKPLLDGFTDEQVFAVSCQIFLGDPSKRREETGLTGGWWRNGGLRVTHREDAKVNCLFPCFYGGGGSCAFDRRKFLSLGGFDEILAPFYLEDTDIGFLAWKRGWKVLYQPASVVHHEHRGTIGRKFSREYIESVLQKNYILFAWKNIHDWSRLASHFIFSAVRARGALRAFRQLPGALRSRWRARRLAVVSDTEAFRRSDPAWFHDRFSHFENGRMRVLFVSPYSVYPPTHGGGVFMYNTIRQLSRHCDVHAIVMLDYARERAANERELAKYCASAEFIVRTNDKDPHLGSIVPHAVHEFHTPEIEWLIRRETLLHRIDVIQLEYTALGQYARQYRNLVCALFEHDVYFQSIARSLPFMRSPIDRIKARFEYLRAIRYELNLLPRCDEIQVCTAENRAYLESFLPKLAPHVDAGLRAGINTSEYPYPGGPRAPNTMLFLGSFRHVPNQVALDWFIREVLPLVLQNVPDARLLVAGSDPPPRHAFADPANAIDLLGFVEDIQPLFSSCAVFVCPIRSGSGVRVKLLEAFASGVPVVSTTLGAEGLARTDGEFCALADEPQAFADRVVRLLGDSQAAAGIASRARAEVEANWDMAVITERLARRYAQLLAAKR
ncbi:MAG: glycosyltransferase [Acidobacteriota bacterium]|nr:glycosyltransferase [Acidobacteriota bacterium]